MTLSQTLPPAAQKRPISSHGPSLWVGLALGLLWLGGLGSLAAATIGVTDVMHQRRNRRRADPFAWAVAAIGIIGVIITALAVLLIISSGTQPT